MTRDEVLVRLAARLALAENQSAEAVRRLSAAEGTPGEPAARKAADAACDAEERIIREMAHVRAEGEHGLAVKAARLAEAVRDGATAADTILAASVSADVARLVPEIGKEAMPPPCAMADLARQAMGLWDALDRADTARMKATEGGAQLRHEAQYRAIYDQLSSLEDHASHVRAQSIEGAMFALVLARGEVCLLEACGVDENEANARLRRVVRLLYSALRALEAVSGTPAEEVGAAHYMARELDPFAAVETALRQAA